MSRPEDPSGPPSGDPPPPGREWEPEVEGVLDRALELVRFLRIHCPWDRAQTPRTLLPHLLEESHEVADAVRDEDPEALEGELGDLLLNLAFQVVLGEEEERFTRESVTRRLEEKIARRHPHLFGLGEKEGWEEIKARERPGEGILSGLASGMEPLLRAHRIQERVSGVGFDWADPEGALQKVGEEVEEVRQALEEGPADPVEAGPSPAVEEEVGDLLFAVVNLARLAGVHSSEALESANRKFSVRFRRLEVLARERGVSLPDASLEDLDRIWEELKGEEKEGPGAG